MTWGAVKPLLVNVPIFYPLERSENLCFSGVFRGYKIGTSVRNGVTAFCTHFSSFFDELSDLKLLSWN